MKTAQINVAGIECESDLERLSHGAVVKGEDSLLVYDKKESLRHLIPSQKLFVFYARKNEELITRYAIWEGHILVKLDGKMEMIGVKENNLRKEGDGHLLSEEKYSYQLADNLLRRAGL